MCNWTLNAFYSVHLLHLNLLHSVAKNNLTYVYLMALCLTSHDCLIQHLRLMYLNPLFLLEAHVTGLIHLELQFFASVCLHIVDSRFSVIVSYRMPLHVLRRHVSFLSYCTITHMLIYCTGTNLNATNAKKCLRRIYDSLAINILVTYADLELLQEVLKDIC